MTDVRNNREPDGEIPPFPGKLGTMGAFLLHHSPDAVYLLDQRGILLDMSESFRELLGFPREDLQDKHLSLWDMGASPSGPPEHSGPSLFRRQDGRTFPVDVVLTHLPPEHGSLLYCSARDKTYEQVLVGDFRSHADPDTLQDNLEQPRDRLDSRQANQDSPVPQEFLESIPSPIAVLHDRTIIQSNLSLASMLGFGNTKSLVGKTLPDLCADTLEKNRISALAFRLEEAGLICIPSLRLRKRDGETFPCDLSLTLLPGRGGKTATATFTDATDIARLRKDLEHSMDYQRILFEKNGAGLLILDEDRTVLDVSPALCRMTGYEREEIVGHREWLLSGNQESFRDFNHGFQETLEGRTFHTESRFRCKNGSTGWAEITESGIPLPNGRRGVFLTLTDATALHDARKAIIHQVIHDPLTGMPNRIALEQAISGAIARARRKGTVFAVGMFDLDDFKPVNDKFGHEVGNRLLKEFSQRLRSQLRESDFLARIAGDEFVVVIEDLDAGRSTHQLTQVMERLHQAVEIPFKLVADSEAQVGMSMGLALFPSDGEDGDTLLRKAGAAMYQAKIDKGGRTEWWRLGPFPTNSPTQEGPFDAYSLDTNDLLSRHRPHIDSVILQFVETFFVQISDDPGLRDILSTMDEREIQTIAAFQSKHLSFLLAPSTTKEMILKQAHQVGKVHALAGINGALLTQSMGLYRRLLSEHLNQTFLTARDRYRILLANEVRLQDDLQGELRSGIDTTGEYFTLLSGILPRQGALWTDVRSSEIDALGKLPGIQCVFLMRLDSNGTFVVEESSGPSGQEGAAIMRDPAFEAVIDPDTPRGQGLIAHAWRSLQIQRTPSYLKDARLPHWREKVIPLGIRSAVSIPVKNLEGKPVAVVSLYGAYPNQFESPWMQQFAMGLGQRWEKIWELCRTPSAVLREDQAMDYRKELFSGGLSMYMQPVVDLSTGKPVKVEALARLKRSGGEIVSPGFFLPILGDSELDRLFRMGLDESLSWMPRWEEAGLSIGVSLNLPPGTLRDPDCPKWVEEALTRHRIDPSRLTLELLENREIEHHSQDQAINRLLGIGVKLAMDDLGSGYSSLQRLSTMPFDNIKVDQGLLKRIRIAPLQTLSMIGTIVRMGHDFELDVVVEGLEDVGMIEAATILGSPFGQGFALARPMPAEEIVEWSRSFVLPNKSGTIRTYLGALAFHWSVMHSSKPAEACPSFQECPLTHFIEEKGLEKTEGAIWNALLHEKGKDFESISRKMTNWLVEKLHEENM